MRSVIQSLSQSAGSIKKPEVSLQKRRLAGGEFSVNYKRGRIRITPIGELLQAWRKRNKFSQVMAASKLQVSPRTLQNWEQGRREPKGFALLQLREKLR